jgi:hypothetical protein
MYRQDNSKIKQIQEICNRISNINQVFSDPDIKSHFAYDEVIELLEKAYDTINVSVRIPRPDHIPHNISWSEKCYDPEHNFDPYVYDGSMSVEDYERAANACFEDAYELEI